MNPVTATPTLPGLGDNSFGLQLLRFLREHATSINQAAAGRLMTPVQVTASYTAGENDSLIVFKGAGAATITLPAVTQMAGKRLIVQRGDANTGTITISPASGNINGGASVTLTTAYQRRDIVSDGVDYWSA